MTTNDRRTEAIPLAIITAIGAALRLFWLADIPTGWHHDEALMGVMASQVYQGVNRPIFFSAYLGQEPLYLYLVAGAIALFGGNQEVLVVRLVSAVVGIATIPMTYLLGRELYGRRVGLVSAALVSFSFWQVMSSRNGYRSITLPFVAALAVWLYWRARRSPSFWPMVIAGLAVAGTWYTYLAGRAFPGVFAAYGTLSVLWSRRLGVRVLGRAVTLIGTAVIGSLPLVYFWATNPGTFGSRIGQIGFWSAGPEFGGPWLLLGKNVLKLIGIFTTYGEPLWRYNIAGRPIFVWLLAPAFWIGVAILFVRVWRREPASIMVFGWLAVMTLPCILSEEVGAYTLRAMGMVPAMYLLPALALVASWGWLERTRSRRRANLPAVAIPAALCALLIFEVGLTFRDYFIIWGPSFGAAYEGGTDTVSAARYLQREAHPESDELMVGSEFLGHPVLAQLAPRVYDKLQFVDGSKSMVYRPDGRRPMLYVFPFTTRPWDMERLVPPGTEVARELFPQGITPGEEPPALYTAHRLAPRQAQAHVEKLLAEPGTIPLQANLDGQAQAIGGRLAPRVLAGQTLPASALWRLLASPGDMDYVFFAHLLDYQHKMWAQYDENGYPAAQWQPGEVLASRLDMLVPKDTPPGRYRVEIGVLDRRTGARLPLRDEGSRRSTVQLGMVKVAAAAPTTAPEGMVPANALLGEHVSLVGFIAKPSASSTTDLEVTLVWKATGVPPEDYTVFVQVLNTDGQLVAQSDAMPQGGRQPTGSWEAGESIIDTHTISLPVGLPAGEYQVIAGMYLGRTGQRLPVSAGGDYVVLGTINLPIK